MAMKLGVAVDITVIEARPDGRGGVIEIPVISETPYIDFGQTEGGGSEGSVTPEMLAQMAANFPRYPAPVTVGTMTHSRNKGGPAPGFIESVRFDGTTLWARIDLGPALWFEVVEERAWRGFSIEAQRDKAMPTIKFEGFVLDGGVFTNDPATDVHYRIAASRSDDERNQTLINVALKAHTKEDDMSGTSDVARLQATIDEQNREVVNLKAKLAAAEAANETAEGEVKDLKAAVETLQADLGNLTTQLADRQQKSDAERVLELKKIACERKGFLPAYFEGVDDDPVAWLKKRHLSVAGLESIVLSGVEDAEDPKPVSTGNPSRSESKLGRLDLAVKKTMAEHKCSYPEAVELIRSTDPDMFSAAMETYKTPERED